MRQFNDDEILDRVESLASFKGWKKGVYDVWIRSAADAYDLFDDKAFTYLVETEGQRPKFVMSRIGTSNAGSYGLKHFDDYNREGCAVLKSDTIVYGSHAWGRHKGKKLAYVQVKGFPYYRDGNKNERAEEIGPVHTDIIGANIHRAGVNSTLVKNWSVACLVTANEAKFVQFLDFMQSQGKPALNVAILKEWPKGSAAPAGSSAGKKSALAGDTAEAIDAGNVPTGSGPASDGQPTPPGKEQAEKTEFVANDGEAKSVTQSTNVAVGKEVQTGFFAKIKRKLAAWFAWLGGLAGLNEYKQQIDGLGLPSKVILWAIIASVAAAVVWIIYEFAMHVIECWGKRKRTDTLAQVNSTPTNTVLIVPQDQLDEYEKQGWIVIRRQP